MCLFLIPVTTGLGVARIFDPQGRLYGSFRTS